MRKLDEIKSIFYGEGYTISNKYGLDKEGLGQWVDDTDWLIKQAEKVERYEKALEHISTRKMSTYLSTSHMNQDFIKTALEALTK